MMFTALYDKGVSLCTLILYRHFICHYVKYNVTCNYNELGIPSEWQ